MISFFPPPPLGEGRMGSEEGVVRRARWIWWRLAVRELSMSWERSFLRWAWRMESSYLLGPEVDVVDVVMRPRTGLVFGCSVKGP